MQLKQSVLGWLNKQSITIIQQKPCIDIFPTDIDEMLDYVITHDGTAIDSLGFVEPDLTKKNPLNGVDTDKYRTIRGDFIHFSAIDEALKADVSRNMKEKYQIAARILNEQYLSEFKGDFPGFAVQVVSKYSQINGNAGEKAVKLFVMINYMYSECDIGVIP
jgi:hypothetical protein